MNNADAEKPLSPDMPHEEEPKEKEGIFDLLKEVVRFTVIALFFIIPIRVFIAQPYIVSGASMYPTLESGEYLIVDQLSYRFRDPVRGEVIIFRFPQDTSKYFIKRVIGLPGETVSFAGGVLSVASKDGAEITLDEPYLGHEFGGTFLIDVPENKYFMMGDNRDASLDSRVFGAVSREYVVGRALVRLLPPTKAGVFPGFYDYGSAR